MATFSLGKHPHVELCDLLKLEGWSESGAQAKIAIGIDRMVMLFTNSHTIRDVILFPAMRPVK